MVIQTRGDWWQLDGNVPSHIVGYKQFVDGIAADTQAFATLVGLA